MNLLEILFYVGFIHVLRKKNIIRFHSAKISERAPYCRYVYPSAWYEIFILCIAVGACGSLFGFWFRLVQNVKNNMCRTILHVSYNLPYLKPLLQWSPLRKPN
uniref:Uncharacterized protein n=1 Tax=Glossina brevipalpis TaxID=37001 RepID=A0A1A9WZT8_9MUSC